MDNLTSANNSMPLPGAGPVVTPEVSQTVAPEVMMPKKKKNGWKIFGGVMAIVLVVVSAWTAFNFSNYLALSDVPTAPSSAPEASTGFKPWQSYGSPKARLAAKCQQTGDCAGQKEVPNPKPLPTVVSPGNTAGPINADYLQSSWSGEGIPFGSYDLDTDNTLLSTVKNQYPGTYGAGQLCGTASDCAGQKYRGFYSVTDPVTKKTTYRPIATTTEEKGSNGGNKTVASCVATTWTPDVNTVCTGVTFEQTSNCNTKRNQTGTKTGGTCTACTVTTWTPLANTVCVGTNLTQTSNCGTTQSVAGTKTDGTCAAACTVTTWTPNRNTVCVGTNLTQTSNCNTTQSVAGTKVCGSPDLTTIKMAFRDETSNAAGNYKLNNEIDKVSKDQVFVYAFEVTNDGDGDASEIKIVDVLKGNNQELLSFVDGESACKYTSSSRTVTCTGMSLAAGETDYYAFRVKVAASAVNGDTIKNTGVISYKEMPGDGETEASAELLVSTVVGCNNTCTGDSECVSGLSCDIGVNKCRRSICADSSNCICPTERVTAAPTRAATQAAARVQPTVLPETGILDFPGVAAFGGGLLMAVVGILLAL